MCLATQRSPAVSVLDLDNFVLVGLAPPTPSLTRGRHTKPMFLSLNDVKADPKVRASNRTIKGANGALDDPVDQEQDNGGSRRTRTSDLTLIRRTL